MHLTEFIEQRFKNKPDSVLEIGFSEITDIAGFDCQNLRVLRLHANQITKVDDFDCKHLIELELDANQIRSLAHFNCKTLKVLSLCENRITSIAHFDCKNLVDINLSENEIASIDDFDCKNLQELSLGANPIKSIHAFDPKNLEYLNLDYCEIDYVAPEVEEKLLKILSPVNDVKGKWGEKLEQMRERRQNLGWTPGFFESTAGAWEGELRREQPTEYEQREEWP